MKTIDYKWNKRNGNGHTTCHLCNKLTWDNCCYNFELKILDKELFNTILCGDCILKIKNKEFESRVASFKEIIEEDKEIKELNLKDGKVIGTWENGSEYCYTLSAPQVVIIKKINELVKAVNSLKENK